MNTKEQLMVLVEHLVLTLPTDINVEGVLMEDEESLFYRIGDISIDTFQDNRIPKGIKEYIVYGLDSKLIGLYWMWDIPKGSTIIFKQEAMGIK